MAKNRSMNEEVYERQNPYDEYPEDQDYDGEYDDGYDEEYDQDAYSDGYEDGEYPEDGYEEEEEKRGFMSGCLGKVLVALIILLLLAIAGLLGYRYFFGREDAPQGGKTELPQQSMTQQIAGALPSQEQTSAPSSIVFAPVAQATAVPTAEPTDEPTPAPTAEPTQEPTAKPTATPEPEPTATPLPIILTNTPTPSPTPSPSPSPTPTPSPTPSPKPTPSPVPMLGTGVTNREANLRESASSSGKVKLAVKKGEAITVHQAVLDKSGKVWYFVTVDDQSLSGWMRDYVINLDSAIAAPTATPKVTATPKPGQTPESEQEEKAESTPEPTPTPNANAIGTGKTNRDANVRKIMNGSVLVQLRKNRKVDILSVRRDKNGDIWYEVQVQGTTTVGFVRDYVITLDSGVKLDVPTPTPKPQPAEQEGEEPAQVTPEPTPTKNPIKDREIIGSAKTNRSANVRVEPDSGAKIVRQLSKGIDLLILDKYQDSEGKIWYEVSTTTGKTHGFVRDYLIDVKQMDAVVGVKVYGEE